MRERERETERSRNKERVQRYSKVDGKFGQNGKLHGHS